MTRLSTANNNDSLVLPDIAGQSGPSRALTAVGMRGIAMPIAIVEGGATVPLLAKVDAMVDLAADAGRGIHMSRIFNLLDAELAGQTLTEKRLATLVPAVLASHANQSTRAWLRIGFELPLRRPALVSALAGWRAYPCRLEASLGPTGSTDVVLVIELAYSSTCPNSAALARSLTAEAFSSDFAGAHPPDPSTVAEWLENTATATPHSQRSIASVRLLLQPGEATSFAITDLIDRFEQALGAPVQTAVKRADEQAFAALNARNPLFCEDAARRLAQIAEQTARVRGYRIDVAHLESLHAHDAVARATGGEPVPIFPALQG